MLPAAPFAPFREASSCAVLHSAGAAWLGGGDVASLGVPEAVPFPVGAGVEGLAEGRDDAELWWPCRWLWPAGGAD